jgi:putative restriction endonuclease
LHTDKNQYRWPVETYHRAPYKPILLLSVLDLIGLSVIRENFIAFDEELLETFNLYYNRTIGKEKNSGPLQPYFYMRSEGFWELIPQEGKEQAQSDLRQIDSLIQLHKLVIGARLDDELFELIQNSKYRERLADILIQTYLVPELQERLSEARRIKTDALEYGQILQTHRDGSFKVKDASNEQKDYHEESRSVAFRKVVRKAYDYTCAMCGIRVLTPEGAAAVEAAHIVPWNVSHNDDPRNGMALCGLHHWVFDQGLVCVDGGLRIRISPIVVQMSVGIGALQELDESEIHKPVDRYFWPAKQALSWHRSKTFRSSS